MFLLHNFFLIDSTPALNATCFEKQRFKKFNKSFGNLIKKIKVLTSYYDGALQLLFEVYGIVQKQNLVVHDFQPSQEDDVQVYVVKGSLRKEKHNEPI